MMLDCGSGNVTVRHAEKNGEQKTSAEHLDLPDDIANGIIPTVLKNVRPESAPFAMSMVVATPKPRLVKLTVSTAGTDAFSTTGLTQKAIHYVITPHVEGLAGLLAPLVGKQPPDAHVWILPGTAPAFVRSKMQAYLGGPTWLTELASPVWPRTAVDVTGKKEK
jgi:hypothetical protein